MILKEDTQGGSVHIYQDDATGKQYIFDGTTLILINQTSPTIGDSGDEETQKAEDEWHEKKLERDRQENPDAHSDDEEESDEEKQARLDRIKNMFSDESTAEDIKNETEKITKRETKRKKQKETKTYSSDIQRFSMSLEKFIASQLKKIRRKTWKVENQKYSGSGIVKRGTRREKREIIPLINVYFDQSGSWTYEDIKIGEDAIGVLNNYVKRHEIEIDVYYFANEIGETPDEATRNGNGTGAGAKLIQHIKDTNPTNVIVMTDDDFDSTHWDQIDSAPNISIPGAVWYLFRGNKESVKLQKHLKGRTQSSKYFF